MVDALEEFEQVMEAEPILMLLPPSSSDWVIRKVAKVKRRMGHSFKGMGEKIEEFFWEVECHRSWSLRRLKEIHRHRPRNSYSRELKIFTWRSIMKEGHKGELEGKGEGGSLNLQLMMNFKIIYWNAKGLGKKEKHWGVKRHGEELEC